MLTKDDVIFCVSVFCYGTY